MNRLHTLGALSLALLLAACGGDDGGGGAPAVPPVSLSEVPDSALASSQAFSQFVSSLPASDTGEGLKVNDAQAPASDTDEPMLLS